MLETELSPHKQEAMTLRDYLQRYTQMKKMRSTPESGKALQKIQSKPQEQFINRINALRNFLQDKIQDKNIKIQIEKKIYELVALFKKTLQHWKIPLEQIKFRELPQKQNSSRSSTAFSSYLPAQTNKLLTQPRIQEYEIKSSVEASNGLIPLEKLTSSKTGFETKLSINVQDSHQITPSIMRIPSSNEQLIRNKSLQWVRSSNVIEQKDGDHSEESPHDSLKNQTLKQKIRKEKEKKERERMVLKNQIRHYQPPKISKKASGFDYSVRNLQF